MKDHIIIGTRGSALALWQTQWVTVALQKIYPTIIIKQAVIKTTGDKILDSPLSKIGDKGLFTKELEKAMLDGKIDLAVHSLKDVPTVIPDGLILGAIAEREDVHDVFVSHPQKKYSGLDAVPVGGTIATGSLRRKCQLLAYRPDLNIVDIRGNLQSRKEKLDASDWDGMLLAKAGVTRLGWESLIAQIIDMSIILPAVGQGALAIEIRKNDNEIADMLAPLNHTETRLATMAERALLKHLEGGCQIPIGAYARVENNKLALDAVVGSLDGKMIIRSSITGNVDDVETLGIMLANELISRGADKILDAIRQNGNSYGNEV
ncbi:hydroxymethylbilane synthase [bacterium]|nr:hydroxymethylbilane synthase [bacterium]